MHNWHQIELTDRIPTQRVRAICILEHNLKNIKTRNCPTTAGPTALSTPLFSTPRSRGVGTPRVAGPLAKSLRGQWVSGLLLRATVVRTKGRRPKIRPSYAGG